MANKKPLKISSGQLQEFETGDTVPAANIELDTDGTLAANSDSAIASQKAVKTYVTANAGGITLGKAVTISNGYFTM